MKVITLSWIKNLLIEKEIEWKMLIPEVSWSEELYHSFDKRLTLGMQKYDKIEKIREGTYGMVFKGKNKEIQEVLA